MDPLRIEENDSKDPPPPLLPPTTIPVEHMENIDLETDTEKFERQIEELTKQLNESKLAEKYAKEEREKYFQLYNETKQSVLTSETQQLNQIRRILNTLATDQPETLSRTSENLSCTFESSLSMSNDQDKIEPDWSEILAQISGLMDLTEKLTSRCADQNDENAQLQDELTILRSNYDQEKQIRHQLEKQMNEANKLIEMDHSKRLQKLRNYASLADDEGDIVLSSLMKKAEKNDVDFGEMKRQYESLYLEQTNEMKKLIKERELLHLYIQRLERENALLSSRTNQDETIQLLTHASQTPHSLEEAKELIEQLRTEITEQLKSQDKLKNDIQQFHCNYKIELREREQIEELLTRDLNAAKDQILVLESIRSEYEHVVKIRHSLQRELEQCTNEYAMMQGGTNSLIDHLKEQVEKISLSKANLEEENQALREQIQKLKIDYENSESVQHDFVKLSQALQVQLEEFRNAGTELRWQHDEDFTECQQCHLAFSMTWRKQHCLHCGKVLCKDCVSKTILSGPNKRPARVCDVCYTLLNKTSQPYFAGVPDV